MNEVFKKTVMEIIPNFKIEQVAIATNDAPRLMATLGALLGLKDWASDHVVANAVVFNNLPCENEADLHFNYDLGFELELLTYTSGPNWHVARKAFGSSCPFLSHIGFHTEEKVAQEVKAYLALRGIGMAQEVWTKSHTNPVIAGKRTYHYMVFDSKEAFGFDLKLIMRTIL